MIKQMFFYSAFFLLINFTSYCQNKNELWQIKDADYIHTYNDLLTIVIIEDHSVIRDMILVEPSLNYLFNTEFIDDRFGDSFRGIITLQKEQDSLLHMKDIRFRFGYENYNIDKIDSIFKELKFELIKSDNSQNQISFGFYFYRSVIADSTASPPAGADLQSVPMND